MKIRYKPDKILLQYRHLAHEMGSFAQNNDILMHREQTCGCRAPTGLFCVYTLQVYLYAHPDMVGCVLRCGRYRIGQRPCRIDTIGLCTKDDNSSITQAEEGVGIPCSDGVDVGVFGRNGELI